MLLKLILIAVLNACEVKLEIEQQLVVLISQK